MSSQAPITMPEMLSKIGHRLKGASDAISTDEVFSSLDCVRFAAFSNNHAILSCKPCPLISDTLEPTSFFVHKNVNKKDDDTTNQGGVRIAWPTQSQQPTLTRAWCGLRLEIRSTSINSIA